MEYQSMKYISVQTGDLFKVKVVDILPISLSLKLYTNPKDRSNYEQDLFAKDYTCYLLYH